VVKCPKCGSFSYSELTQCTRCGASLAPAAQPPPTVAKVSPVAQADIATPDEGMELEPSSPAVRTGPPMQNEAEVTGPNFDSRDPDRSEAAAEPSQASRPLPVNLDLGFARNHREDSAATATPAPTPQAAAWRQELSERVSSFRQRRARFRNEPPPEENLDFEFERSETKTAGGPEMERFLEFPQSSVNVEAEIGSPVGFENDALYSDAERQELGDAVFEIPDSPRPRAEDVEIGPASNNRLEIVVGPSEAAATTAATSPELEAFLVASLGRRFLAGLIDGLLLLLAGGLFALIFRFAGGYLAPTPLDLAVLAVIAFIFVWSYFGMFATLTFSTPGQACMGIVIRNMEGEPPVPHESLLRAFGYLVSLSAFMLGFFWALVDSESLTWHDRISGTFLTLAERKIPAKGVKL